MRLPPVARGRSVVLSGSACLTLLTATGLAASHKTAGGNPCEYPLPFNVKCAKLALVIRTFKDKEAEKIFRRERSRRLPEDLLRAALRKLRMLNRAVILDDLRVPPANHLEKLKGDRAGQYSIRINDQWRICFYWRDNDAFDVEIVAYHRG
jgi:proteic killer suppression protein